MIGDLYFFKITCARLSGTDYSADAAERMYHVAAAAGFDEITTSRHAAVAPRRPSMYCATAQPSGVSGWFDVEFNSAADMYAWAAAATVVEPSEPAAAELYRALLAASAGGES
jgi:hypothetical protein